MNNSEYKEVYAYAIVFQTVKAIKALKEGKSNRNLCGLANSQMPVQTGANTARVTLGYLENLVNKNSGCLKDDSDPRPAVEYVIERLLQMGWLSREKGDTYQLCLDKLPGNFNGSTIKESSAPKAASKPVSTPAPAPEMPAPVSASIPTNIKKPVTTSHLIEDSVAYQQCREIAGLHHWSDPAFWDTVVACDTDNKLAYYLAAVKNGRDPDPIPDEFWNSLVPVFSMDCYECEGPMECDEPTRPSWLDC